MAVESFFKSVTLGGFPKPAVKAQPWKKVWPAPQDPTKDGKMVVACPKKCVYGMSVSMQPLPLIQNFAIEDQG
jgi:hypothetical protein